jgi:hypothetical protein
MAAAVSAALIAAIAPTAGAAPRSLDRTAVAAPDSGWSALLGPWHAIETWLRNAFGADSGEGGEGGGENGGGEGDDGETTGGGSPEESNVPPTCGPGTESGPCTDPDG